MLKNEQLYDAMTDIDDDFIRDAYEFGRQKPGQRKRGLHMPGRRTGWGVAAACAAIVLLGGSVYAGQRLISQLHIASYDDPQKLMETQNIDSENHVTLSVTDGVFNEGIYRDSQKVSSLIDRLADSESTVVTAGSADAAWTRRYSDYPEPEEDSAVGYYEAYDYPDMQDALSDYGVALDLGYLQEHYPIVSGEYGCDMGYTDDSRAVCLNKRFFSGYRSAQGQIVGLEYIEDLEWDNAQLVYELYDRDVDTEYYETKDGVEVYLVHETGSLGGSRVSAEVLTEHRSLYVTMYGDFAQEEVEAILDSLHIAEAMS